MDEVELEEHIKRAALAERTVSKLQVHMVDFLRTKVAQIREQEPDMVSLLQDFVAKDAIGDLYESLMAELDESDEWDEQDTLEAASLYLLMTLGMKDGGDEESEETDEENEEGDDDESGDEDDDDN